MVVVEVVINDKSSFSPPCTCPQRQAAKANGEELDSTYSSLNERVLELKHRGQQSLLRLTSVS